MTALEQLNFYIVIPQAATNLVTNPSLETNTTGHNAVGGASLARVATHQRRGAWALEITPVDSVESGSYYGDIAVTSGVEYTYSIDILGVDGQNYELQLVNTSSVERASFAYIGTGRWDRIELTFTATATESWRLYVVRDASETGADKFYIDGLQFEVGPATTYFDGDMVGFVSTRNDFGWNGTRHGSTSYRTAKTRAGGSLLAISDYATLVKATGFGLGPFSQSYSALITGGALSEGFTLGQRQPSLLLEYNGSMSEMWDKRKAIIDAVRPDYTGTPQPMVIRFQGTDSSGKPATEPVDIICNIEPCHLDTANAPATQQDLLIVKTIDALLPGAFHEGAQLDFADSLTNANYILMRDSDGVWQELGTGIGGTTSFVFCIKKSPDGDIYVGGSFSTANGVTVNNIARWNGTTFEDLDGGVNGSVFDIIWDNYGNLYATGTFTTAGSGATTVNYIAKWNGTAWSDLDSGLNAGGLCLAIDTFSNLYVGGLFTTAGAGPTTVNRIAKWNGTAWSDLDSGVGGASAQIETVAFDKNGDLYVGGNNFDEAGSGPTTVHNLARWDGLAWYDVGGGIGDIGVKAIAFAPNGDLYIGGDFSISAGSPADYIAIFNGVSINPVPAGSPNNLVEDINIDGNGGVYIGGQFTSVGDLSLSDRIAVLRSGSWQGINVDLPGTPTIYAIGIADDNSLYFGFSTYGTAISPGVIALTNNSAANAINSPTAA